MGTGRSINQARFIPAWLGGGPWNPVRTGPPLALTPGPNNNGRGLSALPSRRVEPVRGSIGGARGSRRGEVRAVVPTSTVVGLLTGTPTGSDMSTPDSRVGSATSLLGVEAEAPFTLCAGPFLGVCGVRASRFIGEAPGLGALQAATSCARTPTGGGTRGGGAVTKPRGGHSLDAVPGEVHKRCPVASH